MSLEALDAETTATRCGPDIRLDPELQEVLRAVLMMLLMTAIDDCLKGIGSSSKCMFFFLVGFVGTDVCQHMQLRMMKCSILYA